MTEMRPVHEVSETEASRRFDELLDLVEAGDEIVITRDGKPLGRLISLDH